MTSWSYSHYSVALQCLRKYKYVAIDKLVHEGPESSDLIFGSALHSAINAVLTGEDGPATFDLYWGSYKNKEVEYGRFNWQELQRLGEEFIRKFGRFHAPKYKLVQAEKRLYGSYRGVRLEGTPDFYGQYSGRASLRDFKTSARNYDSTKSDSALQLYLYAFLYKANNPESVIDTLGYTVFNKGTGSIQDLTWDFRERDMFEALDGMVSYVGIVSGPTGHDFPKNYNNCNNYNRRCEFWNKCYGKRSNDE